MMTVESMDHGVPLLSIHICICLRVFSGPDHMALGLWHREFVQSLGRFSHHVLQRRNVSDEDSLWPKFNPTRCAVAGCMIGQ